MDKLISSQRFTNFAQNECHGSSNLYEYLSLQIANDDELLELCSHARIGQPIPNLFFGAVHFLLQKGTNHLLKNYYPSIVEQPLYHESSFLYFKDFCLTHQEEIYSILKTKLVQTNEVRRCAYLYPSFCYIYDKVKKPLSIIEIGCSSGLNLLWDHYSYSYETNTLFGNLQSDVQISSQIKGEKIPFLLSESPPVASRVGVDLFINDIHNSDDYLWLKSLIWPEHSSRLQLFEKATNCFKKNPAQLIEGDGISLLESIIKEIPKEHAICIFHTHVANQIPEDSKNKLVLNIEDIANNYDVFHLYNNMWDKYLHLDSYSKRQVCKEILAETDGHGRWFTWKIDHQQ